MGMIKGKKESDAQNRHSSQHENVLFIYRQIMTLKENKI